MAGEFTYTPVEASPYLKHVVNVCHWSPKTDLIAIGTQSGTVSVHRYKLTCVWESAEPNLGKVTALAWQPDGKSLAVAHHSGVVRFYLTNDGFLCHELQLFGCIHHLSWAGVHLGDTSDLAPVSRASTYFPELTSLAMFQHDTSFSSSDVGKLSHLLWNSTQDFNLLVVIVDSALHIYGCSSFHIASYSIQPKSNDVGAYKIEFADCAFSPSSKDLLALFTCTYNNGSSSVELHRIRCNGLLQYRDQLRNLSLHCSAIRMCKSLVDWSFGQICVSWEDMILEMDSKFTSYARQRYATNTNWSLSVELVEFILFGNCPRPLRKFLVEDWTAQTLKRTGTATLKAYESIKTICFQQLQLLLQRLIFHTSELLGNLLDKQRYSRFGVSSEAVVKVINTTASVLQKTQELYIVIEKSVTHLRAFFKWLYIAIYGQSGRVLSDDLTRITTSERELVIDFATNYLRPIFAGGELKSYQVDLVQQYIQPGEVRKPLSVVVEHSLTKDKERAGLRKLVQFSKEAISRNELPVGCFRYCPKATLCDLIKKNLENDINQLFGLETEGDLSRGCLNLDQVTSHRLFCGQVSSRCAFQSTLLPTHACLGVNRSTFQTLDTLSADESDNQEQLATIVAWNPPTHPLTSPSGVSVPDGLLLLRLDNPSDGCTSSFLQGIHLQVDSIPCSAHPDNLPIFLQSFHFYSPELLLLLINEMVQPGTTGFPAPPRSWWVTVPLTSAFHAAGPTDSQHHGMEAASQSPLWSADRCPPTPLPIVKLSSLISTANVESLPWFTVKMAVNGERSIVLALFKGQNTCRVYLVERLEDATMESDALLTT